MLLFCIGELEYERTEYRGARAVSIHIPSDCALTQERLRESLKMAQDFMKNFIRTMKTACTSANPGFFPRAWLRFCREPRISGSFRKCLN